MSKVKLKAPDGVTSVSWDGVEYPVGKNGVVGVPAESLLTLYGFGFGNVPEDEKPAKASKAAEFGFGNVPEDEKPAKASKAAE